MSPLDQSNGGAFREVLLEEESLKLRLKMSKRTKGAVYAKVLS